MRKYFEGWYYKVVDPAEKYAFAFIPGRSVNSSSPHSFIQLNDGNSGQAHYLEFGRQEFSQRGEAVRIGENRFSPDRIRLNIDRPGITARGELQFRNVTGWPWPGAMGPFVFAPFMECYHGILSFNSSITGRLEINGELINFSDGKGYVEKDWGHSMPTAWFWAQSNHFDEAGVSLSVSVARVPYLSFSFSGLLIGWLFRGHLFKFTTYNRSRIRHFRINGDKVSLAVENKHYLLEIEADAAGGAVLSSPILGEMRGWIKESLRSAVKVSFYALQHGERELIFRGEGRNAGIEIL
jgi:tocopherol cyclase